MKVAEQESNKCSSNNSDRKRMFLKLCKIKRICHFITYGIVCNIVNCITLKSYCFRFDPSFICSIVIICCTNIRLQSPILCTIRTPMGNDFPCYNICSNFMCLLCRLQNKKINIDIGFLEKVLIGR